jgi:ribosomal protein S18 acetylase RimI-like enzyme
MNFCIFKKHRHLLPVLTIQLKPGMALKLIDHGSKEYQQMVTLRYDLLRKPLGLQFEQDELEKEKEDILIGAFDDEKILGCCLITRTEPATCRLRQMAVHNSLQGKGIGAAMLYFAENVARDRGFRTMTMHARKTALGFYEKLGYKPVGDEFIEVTIPHFVMEKKLS